MTEGDACVQVLMEMFGRSEEKTRQLAKVILKPDVFTNELSEADATKLLAELRDGRSGIFNSVMGMMRDAMRQKPGGPLS